MLAGVAEASRPIPALELGAVGLGWCTRVGNKVGVIEVRQSLTPLMQVLSVRLGAAGGGGVRLELPT